MAQDTGGVKDAGPWITAAKPEYTVLIDEHQIVTQKFGMVNVPTGVWIDERGRIVRPNEVAFIDDRFKVFTGMESAPYVAAIRDWAANGARSIYALSETELKARLKPPDEDRGRQTLSLRSPNTSTNRITVPMRFLISRKHSASRRTTGITNGRPGPLRMPIVIMAPTSKRKSTSSMASRTTNRTSCRW